MIFLIEGEGRYNVAKIRHKLMQFALNEFELKIMNKNVAKFVVEMRKEFPAEKEKLRK